mmetsp:Transcript_22788/g.32615  ORF Transcript_22788/g.32615 Transcript_22788/m.32615 type:complete len:384 (+) Transcript_22788:468-1619(+)
MAAARPTFKNVGLTSWKESKYLVAIWGDEGLDMPLSTPDGTALFTHQIKWLQHLINERHQRNWAKIDRFVQGARAIPFIDDQQDDHGEHHQQKYKIPKSYDVIGDVAVLYTMPDGMDEAEAGAAILGRNKAIKVCALRTGTLEGTERATTMKIIAGIQRDPLVTSHTEYGIKCVVDLNNTFFSPRMGPERLRICQQVARGEHVLVLFAGVGMEALQISGRTEAEKVVAIELNPSAVRCMINAHRMLQRSKSIKTAGAADRFHIVEGDVLDILPTLEKNSFDRILAPRPKEGAMDGDLGLGDGGLLFLEALLPVLKSDGGECHWYDFAADHEFPNCDRTKRTIESACDAYGVKMQMLHIANVGSIAKRQLRICADFRLCGTKDE